MGISFSVVMPACQAEATITASVSSLLAQSHRDWELLLVSDDGVDYQGLLASAGLSDVRIRFLSTGGLGLGEAVARNVGLAAARRRHAAHLDADDRFHPARLARMAAALARIPLVSTATRLIRTDGTVLGTLAQGHDRLIAAPDYKWLAYSGDSLLAWDRQAIDPRYDEKLHYLADLEFLIKLFGAHDSIFHIGTPLFDYVKHPASVSNRSGAAQGMITTKTLLLERLKTGFYSFAHPDARSSFVDFIELSLKLERDIAQGKVDIAANTFEHLLAQRIAAHHRGSADSSTRP